MADEQTDDELKAALLKGDPGGPDTEEVPTFAGPVSVRALSRAEVLRLRTGRELGKLDVAQFEQQMVSLAVVRPKFTTAEVADWQQTDRAGGALADITDKISEISGLSEGAQKSGVPGDGEQP